MRKGVSCPIWWPAFFIQQLGGGSGAYKKGQGE